MENTKIYKRLIMVFALIIATFYVVYQFASSVLGVPISTESAISYTAYNMIETQGFAVRDESIIYSDKSGVAVNAVEDGTKVAATTVVKRLFASAAAAQAYQELQAVNEDIEYYETIYRQQQTHNIDKTTNDNNLKSTYYDILNAVETNDFSLVSSKVKDMGLYITRRQLLTGESFDLEQTISALKARKQTLTEQAGAVTVTSGKVGYYTGEVDGYENVFSYDRIGNITMEQINSAINSKPSAIENSAVGKINESFTWYFLCVVDTAAINSVSTGDMIEVNMPFEDIASFKMKIHSITNADAEHCVLVLESTLMNEKIANFRIETLQLRLEKYSGIRIRSQALRTNEDGETGVYVLVGNLVRFRKTECIYVQGDYMIVEGSALGNDSTLEVHDSVIYEGKNLYDGRVL
ncbi:MAG: hypothetical protein IKU25_09230 [Clostridia bacterium]|nr:hypothetical protein [Clostridia bacterium]